MTSKLRDYIKDRDNHTCKNCGNSTRNEPNLLLEIDHIQPISKGGRTEVENLQTLCWKCYIPLFCFSSSFQFIMLKGSVFVSFKTRQR